MGALHEGHLSLIREARAACDRVVVSIFVNPLQFGPNEDLAGYPRPVARDRELCERAGVSILYHGDAADFYENGFRTTVSVSELTEGMCGPFRPGHFNGVCTVVTKLLLRTLPHVAYFGQKDYQQAVVIERMVRDLDIPVAVSVLPTVREPDGLALSSRNAYLSEPERRAALALWRGLSAAVRLFEHGERRAGRLREACQEVITAEPLARIEYLELADARSLRPIPDGAGLAAAAVLAVGARIGTTRLIDNVTLEP